MPKCRCFAVPCHQVMLALTTPIIRYLYANVSQLCPSLFSTPQETADNCIDSCHGDEATEVCRCWKISKHVSFLIVCFLYWLLRNSSIVIYCHICSISLHSTCCGCADKLVKLLLNLHVFSLGCSALSYQGHHTLLICSIDLHNMTLSVRCSTLLHTKLWAGTITLISHNHVFLFEPLTLELKTNFSNLILSLKKSPIIVPTSHVSNHGWP